MAHHSVALQEGHSRLWVTGGDGRGYPAIDDQIIRRDPLLRLYVRDPELEIGQAGGQDSGRHHCMPAAAQRALSAS